MQKLVDLAIDTHETSQSQAVPNTTSAPSPPPPSSSSSSSEISAAAGTRAYIGLPFKRSCCSIVVNTNAGPNQELLHLRQDEMSTYTSSDGVMARTSYASPVDLSADGRHSGMHTYSKNSSSSSSHGSSTQDWLWQLLVWLSRSYGIVRDQRTATAVVQGKIRAASMAPLEKGNNYSTKYGRARMSRSSRAYSFLFSVAFTAALICYIFVETSVQGYIGANVLDDDISEAAVSHGDKHEGTMNRNHGSPGVVALDQYNVRVQFHPWRLKEQLRKQEAVLSELRMRPRSSIRKPRLALVCASLEATPESAYLITQWKALAVLGYDLEVFPLKGGSLQSTWELTGAMVHLPDFISSGFSVDWTIFDCAILSSWEVEAMVTRFCQDPFKEIPVIWVILREEADPRVSSNCKSPAQKNNAIPQSVRHNTMFERATVVLLSDYSLAMEYSQCDTGNFFVIPGSPVPVWEAEHYMSLAHHNRDEARASLDLGSQDIAVAIVGSHALSYKGVWREHAMVMQAILPISRELQKKNFSLKLFFFMSAGSSAGYKVSLQILAAQLGLENDTVCHYPAKLEEERLLLAADFIVYSSLHEEQAFPSLLIKAMVFDRPIVAPNLTVFRNHMEDGVHGILYDSGGGSIQMSEAFRKVISQLSSSNGGRERALGSYTRSLLVGDSISEFARLLESVIQFPSEAHLPLPASTVTYSGSTKASWQWQVLDHFLEHKSSGEAGDRAGARIPINIIDDRDGRQMIQTVPKIRVLNAEDENNDKISRADWEAVSILQTTEEVEQSEEEQVSERNELLHGTWEEVYRSVRRAENARNELHEREDGELERTGQPICIYEPYAGNGTWNFLTQRSMVYRGISMIPRQRRPGSDDIEASLRLPLLNDPYYQDVLGEFGAFLAIANRIDRIHKNAWIGFQSWQSVGRKVSLSNAAEVALYNEVTKLDHGDVIYFWVSMNSEHSNFWSYCDAINNGNCRDSFLRAFRKMYGLPSNWETLPPMPMDGDHWSVLNSWAMPTSSFVEFIMFSRMFVDALDSEFFLDHHDKGRCPLGSSPGEVRHCYRRLLQLLVNVWAYHSGRRMVLLNPQTGSMKEQHNLLARRGRMWMNFFSFPTLKAMDEDLAEQADDNAAMSLDIRWLWPRSGEVYCQRIYDRERRQRYTLKLEKKKRDKERLRRIRSRQRQRPLARG